MVDTRTKTWARGCYFIRGLTAVTNGWYVSHKWNALRTGKIQRTAPLGRIVTLPYCLVARKFVRVLFQSSLISIERGDESEQCGPQSISITTFIVKRQREKCLTRALVDTRRGSRLQYRYSFRRRTHVSQRACQLDEYPCCAFPV